MAKHLEISNSSSEEEGQDLEKRTKGESTHSNIVAMIEFGASTSSVV